MLQKNVLFREWYIYFCWIMVKLSIISANMRGLNCSYKRIRSLDMLRRRDIDIALIHESHLRTNDVNRLQNKFYRVVASSSDGTKTVILEKSTQYKD